MTDEQVRAIQAALDELPDGWEVHSNATVRWAAMTRDLLQERAALVAALTQIGEIVSRDESYEDNRIASIVRKALGE